MRISRYRSNMVMTIAVFTIVLGVAVGFVVGLLSSVKVGNVVISAFNWTNALISFAPLLAAGMILLGLSQFASLVEEIEAKISKNQEDDE